MTRKFYFEIRCTKCGNTMKYHTDTKILVGKKKRCVYCGKSIDVHKNVIKETTR